MCLFGYVVLLFALLWMLQIEFLPSMYREYHKNRAIEQVSQIGEQFGELGFYAGLTRMALEDTACVRILSESGVEVFSLDYMLHSNLEFMSKLELMTLWEEAERNGGSTAFIYRMDHDRVRRLVPTGATAILCVQVFHPQGAEPVAIYYNRSITPITSIMVVLQLGLRGIILVSVVIAALMVIWVSRITVNPITQIIQKTRLLKEQDYTVTFDTKSYREVAELSELLNETSRTLQRLDNMRRDMLAHVSHDLRTPLSMIIAYSEVMRDIPGENTPENVQIIIDEAVRLTGLINEVLVYPEPSDMIAAEIKCSDFDLAVLCQTIVGRYRSFQKVLSRAIQYEGPDSQLVFADNTKLSQVLYNLIDNAVCHSEASQITVSLSQPQRGIVRVEVCDNGKGIPEEKQTLIWNLNYTDSEEGYHSGAGLSIVRSILGQHGAQCGVKSKPGEGSVFWFELNASPRSP